MWETWVSSPGWEDPLEKEIATHSNTLARKIPWTEESGRLTIHGIARSRTWVIRYVCLGLWPLFDWVVCFSGIELYELLVYFGDHPLSVVYFAIIFSHSEGCLFTLFIVSFAVQKLLSLIKSHLFIFVFISIIVGGGSWRIFLWCMSYSVLPMFSSKSFVVSGLMFRCFYQFWVYLCVWY